MGQLDGAAAEKRGKKHGKGKLKAAPGVGKAVSKEESAWDGVEPERVFAMIIAVLEQGGAVIISQSQDVEMAGVMVLHDDHEKVTVWARGQEAVDALLQEITQYFIDYGSDV